VVLVEQELDQFGVLLAHQEVKRRAQAHSGAVRRRRLVGVVVTTTGLLRRPAVLVPGPAAVIRFLIIFIVLFVFVFFIVVFIFVVIGGDLPALLLLLRGRVLLHRVLGLGGQLVGGLGQEARLALVLGAGGLGLLLGLLLPLLDVVLPLLGPLHGQRGVDAPELDEVLQELAELLARQLLQLQPLLRRQAGIWRMLIVKECVRNLTTKPNKTARGSRTVAGLVLVVVGHVTESGHLSGGLPAPYLASSLLRARTCARANQSR